MKLLILILCMAFTSSGSAQEHFSFNDDPQTEAFKKIYLGFSNQGLKLNKALLSNYQILFVQGLSTHLTHKLGKVLGPYVSKQEGWLSPFYQQIKLLNKLGIESSFVPINPNEGCEKNGNVIADTILQRYARFQKKIIIITQSKGGVDVLHGLVGNTLAMDKVAGWLAYQPPHSGTYLAEAPSNNFFSGKLTDLVFGLFQGSGLAITDMRRDYRAIYTLDHVDEILNVVANVPIVSLKTDELPLNHPMTGSLSEYLRIPFKGEQNEKISFLTPFVNPISNHMGGINDGIAMTKGTCITGNVTCVYLHGIDHFAAVMNTSPYKTLSENERNLVFQSLLHILTAHLR